MHIAIHATELQKKELQQKGFNELVKIEWLSEENLRLSNADAIFNFCFNDDDINREEFINGKPVFVHAVNSTCKEICKET